MVSSGDFSKKPVAKIGYFALRKKGKEKIRLAKVVKCCCQVTWAQKKHVPKESEFLVSKSLNMNV